MSRTQINLGRQLVLWISEKQYFDTDVAKAARQCNELGLSLACPRNGITLLLLQVSDCHKLNDDLYITNPSTWERFNPENSTVVLNIAKADEKPPSIPRAGATTQANYNNSEDIVTLLNDIQSYRRNYIALNGR